MVLKYIEFFFFFCVIPILFFIKIISVKVLMPTLWLIAIYTFIVLYRSKENLNFDEIKLYDLKYILIRFTLISMLVYLIVIILYPILSVIPQELIFRKFFLYRYKDIISTKNLIFINALAFSFVHIVFNNYIAVVFTFLAGLIFMKTYIDTKSFGLVCIEHALYGNMIFTIGLGEYFYHNRI
jgi:membrane protease YdiL (CAAX protease family)